MLLRGERAHLGPLVERVAEPDRAGELEKTFEERVGDPLVEDEPRPRDTGLTLVVKDREGAAADRRPQIGVVEDHIGPFAAELELNPLEVPRRGLDDAAADRGRAGEGDLADPLVLGEVLAGGVAVA